MRSMKKKTVLLGLVIALLVVGNVVLSVKTSRLRRELSLAQETVTTGRTQDQVVAFTRLFIEKVLKAEGEVDFETRLELETAVRALGDEAILQAWQKFTESETEAEAQAEVKNLLTVLVEKFIAR